MMCVSTAYFHNFMDILMSYMSLQSKYINRDTFFSVWLRKETRWDIFQCSLWHALEFLLDWSLISCPCLLFWWRNRNHKASILASPSDHYQLNQLHHIFFQCFILILKWHKELLPAPSHSPPTPVFYACCSLNSLPGCPHPVSSIINWWALN